MKKNPLAFVRVIDKVKLPEQYHKGKKILNKDRQKIRKLYKTTDHSYYTLAKLYNVSYSTIQCIINEETRKKNLIIAQNYRARNKHKRKKQTMELRYRKKNLIEQGKIKLINNKNYEN